MSLMEELIEGFDDQLEQIIEIGNPSQVVKNNFEIRNIVISGMGASGIVGNIVSQLFKDSLKVPLEIVKGYDMPGYINDHTLFIASSYSGNTEEALVCLNEAVERKAIACVVTSGGSILDKANELGLEKFVIPARTDCPRANVGSSFTALMFMLYKYSMISNDFVLELRKGISLIRTEKDAILKRAKSIAKRLKKRSVIIYSDNAYSPIALRLQQQLNENAKQIVHKNIFPEMTHNEIVGWSSPKKYFSNTILISIKNKSAHKSVQKRMEICETIFKEKCDHIIDLETEGESLLINYVYFIHLVDWISYFVAFENDVDPFAVKHIDYVKKQLLSED